MLVRVKQNMKHYVIALGIFLAPIATVAATSAPAADDICCDEARCEGGDTQCTTTPNGFLCYKGGDEACEVEET